MAGGLWVYRRLTMNRAYAAVAPRETSGNTIRRPRRGRRRDSKPFLELLLVNQGIRIYRPEVVRRWRAAISRTIGALESGTGTASNAP